MIKLRPYFEPKWQTIMHDRQIAVLLFHTKIVIEKVR